MVLTKEGVWSPGPPIWHGWTEGPYKGRLEWWADYRYKDPMLRKGKFRHMYYQTPEQDPCYYDPPVPDGTSKFGALQNDAHHSPNRLMPITGPTRQMPVSEWQEMLYKGSWQYQDIAKRCDLSKEHPGLSYSVGTHQSHDQLKPGNQGLLVPRILKYGLRDLVPGPRFHDSPLGDNIHEKPIAMIRAAAIFAPFIAAAKTLRVDGILGPLTYRMIPNTWLMFRGPALLGGVWGTALSTSCHVRDKDDVWNGVIASFIATYVQSAVFQRPGLFGRTILPLTVASTLYYMFRHTQDGIMFPHVSQLGSSGPLVWKLNDYFNEGKDLFARREHLW